MIVLDASAALELLLNGPLADSVSRRVLDIDVSIHAPHLIDLEVAQVLRRFVQTKTIDEPRALQAFDDLEALGITRYPHQLLLPGIWALRNNVTAYDASYLVLAEMLEAKLVTCDAALATVPHYDQWVNLVL